MASPLVSVAIPVYNGERFLGEAIESVLGQTHQPVEVVVVDDASTDGSAAVAESFPALHVIRFPENRGDAAARNAGLAAATGEFIATLDADDLMKPQRLERQLAAVREGADFVLVLEEYLLEDGVSLPPYYTAPRVPVSEGIDCFQTGSFFATREAIERIGPIDESLEWGNDIDFVLRAFDAGLRVEMIEERLAIRRFHGENMTYRHNHDAVFDVLRRRIARKRAAGEAAA